jgi:hypothetical protein
MNSNKAKCLQIEHWSGTWGANFQIHLRRRGSIIRSEGWFQVRFSGTRGTQLSFLLYQKAWLKAPLTTIFLLGLVILYTYEKEAKEGQKITRSLLILNWICEASVPERKHVSKVKDFRLEQSYYEMIHLISRLLFSCIESFGSVHNL